MNDSKLRIGVVIGSTRDGRLGERVAQWVMAQAKTLPGFDAQLLDVGAVDLPLYHDAVQPYDMHGHYPEHAVTAWSQLVAACDGYIFVTPEYNHGLPAPLKNAIDWLYPEWTDKAAALVGYSNGNGAGIRAVEQLRLTLAHVGMATVQQVTTIARAQDHFDADGTPIDDAFQGSLTRELGQLEAWARALRPLRRISN